MMIDKRVDLVMVEEEIKITKVALETDLKVEDLREVLKGVTLETMLAKKIIKDCSLAILATRQMSTN
jgi:hypothetical protein